MYDQSLSMAVNKLQISLQYSIIKIDIFWNWYPEWFSQFYENHIYTSHDFLFILIFSFIFLVGVIIVYELDLLKMKLYNQNYCELSFDIACCEVS